MAKRLSTEDIIKAFDLDKDYFKVAPDLDDSNTRLKEILGSDYGSDIDFLPSSDSDFESYIAHPFSTPLKIKKKIRQIQSSKEIKLSSINGICSSVHEGKKTHKVKVLFVTKLELSPLVVLLDSKDYR